MRFPLPLLALGCVVAITAALPAAQVQDPDNWDLFGDLRIRQESSFKQQTAQDRHRLRLRLRAGANVRITDYLLAGFRARTGNPNDPNNPYVDLGSMNDSAQFNLDRLFIRYDATWLDGFRMLVGKFGNPFVKNPVYSELVWDDDVQPEGAVVSFENALENGPISWYEFQLGEYVLVEQSNGEDSWMTVAQGSTRWRTGGASHLDTSLGWYFYGDTTPDGSSAIVADNGGNALNGPGTEYLSDFGILNPIVSWTTDLDGTPLSLSAEYIKNLRAATGIGDTGTAFGIAYGSSKEPGDDKFWYQYQRIEQDAVFSPFAQDDFANSGAQTNIQGHILGWSHQFEKNLGIRLWGLFGKPETPVGTQVDKTTYRIRFELNVSF